MSDKLSKNEKGFSTIFILIFALLVITASGYFVYTKHFNSADTNQPVANSNTANDSKTSSACPSDPIKEYGYSVTPLKNPNSVAKDQVLDPAQVWGIQDIHDVKIDHDLCVISDAVLIHNENAKTLSDLKVEGLNYSIQNYKYTFYPGSVQNGYSTASYKICARFDTLTIPENTTNLKNITIGNSPLAYAIHKNADQCYKVVFGHDSGASLVL